MLVARLLPFAKNLCTRKFSDEDILEDVQFLKDELTINFQSLTYVIHLFRFVDGGWNGLLLSFFSGHTTSIALSLPPDTYRGRLYMNRSISGRRTQQS